MTLNGDRDLSRAFARQVQADVQKAETAIARAHTNAAKAVLADYLKVLRDDVRRTGFRNSSKLANTWRGRVYPGAGSSMGPAIFIWNRSPEIVDAFSLGLQIRAAGGRFLAVPVGRAVAIVRRIGQAQNRGRDGFGRFVSEGSRVDQVAAALGVRLRYRPPMNGRPGMLTTPTGEPVFLLLKSVKPPRAMQGRALLAQLAGRVEADFAAALAGYV